MYAAAILVALAVGACSRNEPFKTLHVADVVTLLRVPDRKPTLLDANGADFRTKEGIIPGAVLLSNYKSYDVAKELPPEKEAPLVFYCADTH